MLADIEKQTPAQAIMKPSASKGPTHQGQYPDRSKNVLYLIECAQEIEMLNH